MAEGKRYRVGLALSGGGAKGFAHLGVLRALEDMGLHIDVIAGVSAGSVVAAFYAAGLKIGQIYDAFSNQAFNKFTDFAVPEEGLFKLDKFEKFVENTLPVKTFEELPTPLLIGATNFDDCTAVAFHSGAIAKRAVASCSIPIIFKPVTIDGVQYVDGGLLHNLPSYYLRPICDYVIGVNVSPLVPSAFSKTLAGIAFKTLRVMASNNVRHDRKLCNEIVEIDKIATVKTFDIKRRDELIKTGYFLAMKQFSNSPVIKQIIDGQQ